MSAMREKNHMYLRMKGREMRGEGKKKARKAKRRDEGGREERRKRER